MSNSVNGPKNTALWQRADAVIPRGGIYFTRSARFAGKDVMPGFIDHAEGCRVTDVDGKSYIDFNCGNGPNLLGYRHPEVEAAAQKQQQKADLASFFNEAMVDYVEKLVEWSGCMHWAIPVKNGSDATNLAIRVMRAATQKPRVILFTRAYHGFGQEISLSPEFDPDDTTRNIIRLPWNDTDALQALLGSSDHSSEDIAGIMLNPLDQNPMMEVHEASPEFIAAIEAIREKTGALIALDDVRAGFRLHAGGAHRFLNIEPDLLCLGKALGNGHAVAALLGTEPLRDAVEKISLTATYMFSAVCHRAGLAVLEIYQRDNVLEHLQAMGQKLVDGLTEAGKKAGHEDILLSGPATMPTFLFTDDPRGKRARIFAREAALRGAIFHPTLNWFISFAHKDADIEEVISIGEQALQQTPTEIDN